MVEAIDETAARWAVRLDARPLSPEEQTELNDWLASSDRHRGALLRAEASLSYLDRARGLTAGAREGPAIEVADPLFLKRRTFFAVIASGALAATIGGIVLTQPRQERIDTVVGEVRRVPLKDGSLATVNTQSQLQVDIGKTERLVRLSEGEAWFQVAHDASKPFIVEAGDVRVRAVGTAFSVRRRNAGVDVLVTEGQVLAWRVEQPDARVALQAGFRAHLGGNARPEPIKAEAAIERALAWRNGEIAFDGETLGQAVEEFNRYNRRKLVVEDASLANEPLVGFFRTNEPENFARAVSEMIGAHATEQDDRIIISRRSS